MLLIFDVDGTLTPSRGRMDEHFKRWMMKDLNMPFILVTGSDPSKTREQVSDDFFESTTVYNCCGNHVFTNGVETYRSDWHIPQTLESFLKQSLDDSRFHTKTGKHIEHRVGLCNFSIVGRAATKEERLSYYNWDQVQKERISIANRIRTGWKDIDAGVAGETGIDIYQVGTGKDQILRSISRENGPLHFFGDRMDPDGNDRSLADAILDRGLGYAYHVKGWEETWSILQGMRS